MAMVHKARNTKIRKIRIDRGRGKDVVARNVATATIEEEIQNLKREDPEVGIILPKKITEMLTI